MSLLQKWLLAFSVVILVAIATVAAFAGYRAESEFRRYAILYSGRSEIVAGALLAYYREQGSWSGLDVAWPQLAIPGRGRWSSSSGGGNGLGDTPYWVADSDYRVVFSAGDPAVGTRLSANDIAMSRPLVLDDSPVGYLGVTEPANFHAIMDGPANAFVTRLRTALALGGIVAFLAASIVAVFLTRSIVAPLRALMTTAQTIAQGRFEARVPVKGHDEIAKLAETFNQMAASLERAEAARRAQTADIAHELRNPLAVLQSSLEALADGIYEPTVENLEPALAQVQTLNRLVEDLRTLALADAGKLKLDRQYLDLGTLVTRLAESYQGAFQERQLDLSVEVAQSLPSVYADYTRLTQVLNNILLNALRYVPPGGRVRIVARPRDEGLVVCVVDNGPGVRPDQLTRLFDRFWRGEPSRSRVTGGSGLGLAIARQIVEAHGGRIWAEESPGGGLTVCFWLPAKVSAPR